MQLLLKAGYALSIFPDGCLDGTSNKSFFTSSDGRKKIFIMEFQKAECQQWISPDIPLLLVYPQASQLFSEGQVLQPTRHSDCISEPIVASELIFRLGRLGIVENLGSLQLGYREKLLLQVLQNNRGYVVERAVLRQVLECTKGSRALDMSISRLRNSLAGSGEQIDSVRGVGYCLR